MLSCCTTCVIVLDTMVLGFKLPSKIDDAPFARDDGDLLSSSYPSWLPHHTFVITPCLEVLTCNPCSNVVCSIVSNIEKMDLLKNLGFQAPATESSKDGGGHHSDTSSNGQNSAWRDIGEELTEGGTDDDSAHAMLISSDNVQQHNNHGPIVPNMDRDRFQRDVCSRLLLNARVSPEFAMSCVRLYFNLHHQCLNKVTKAFGNNQQIDYIFDESDIDGIVDAIATSGLLSQRSESHSVHHNNSHHRHHSHQKSDMMSTSSSPFPSPRNSNLSSKGGEVQLINCQFDYTTCEGVCEALQVDLMGAQEIAACRAMGELCRNNLNATQHRQQLAALGACELVCMTARKFASNVDVMTQICYAIHSLCVSNHDNGRKLAAAGACGVIVGAARSFPGRYGSFTHRLLMYPIDPLVNQLRNPSNISEQHTLATTHPNHNHHLPHTNNVTSKPL